MPRKPRLDAPGLLHHIIARGIERRAIFVDDADRRRFLIQLHELAGGENNQIHAFSLMPNHIHMCARTLGMPLSTFMRRLLTAYAIYFNKRHGRSGHLFQNRYKSFVVDEETYLLELIRYIHLNPVRAGLVSALEDLERWPYTGHAALMGRARFAWYAAGDVLSLFGETHATAREKLTVFMQEGMGEEAKSMPAESGLSGKTGSDAYAEHMVAGSFDERILGRGGFVEAVLAGLDRSHKTPPTKLSLERLIQQVAVAFNITVAELCSGSRRPVIVRARDALIWCGIQRLGMRASQVASVLNISPSAICTSIRLERGKYACQRLLT